MDPITLPEEVLSMVCQELGQERDFNSLYQCARSSKALADAALRTAYQYHELSPVFIQSDDAAHQESFFQRLTVLWRSIILSSLENAKTYKPYCRYLRMLDFRNLANMLEDFRFGAHIKRSFFASSMQRFHHPKQEKKRQTIDLIATINDVGEVLVPKSSFVEEVSGPLRPGFLTRWIAQLPKLNSIVLYRGDALDQGAGTAIAENCKDFQSLTVAGWLDPHADEVFSRFLNDLKSDTLQYFEIISRNLISHKSFVGLSSQKSLRELKLNSLSREAMENLHGLKECTNLHTLSLEDSTRIVLLESLNNDVYLDVVHWLSNCTELRDLAIKNFADGPSLLATVAVAPQVQWTKLYLEGSGTMGYSTRHPKFQALHYALTEQKSLQSLWLKGNGEDSTPPDLDMMVDTISRLTSLKELSLRDISDEFEEHHITTLVQTLPNLEDFWSSGGEVSAVLLFALAELRYLKNLTLLAITQFSLESILQFIDNLNPDTQAGFNMQLLSEDPDFDLSSDEQKLIQDVLQERVGPNGRFEFVLWRDPAEAEDYGDDPD